MTTRSDSYDVIVIGAGNAGCAAAVSAAQTLHSALPTSKPRILLVDKAPEEWAGGNTYFTAGAYRTVHPGFPEIASLVNNVGSNSSKGQVPEGLVDLTPYAEEDFLSDLKRVTEGKTDEKLARVLADKSWETTQWMGELGVRFQLSFNRQAYEVDGRFKFWGGLALKVEDGGAGLVRNWMSAVHKAGVEVRLNTSCVGLITENGRVAGARLLSTTSGAEEEEIRTKAVILAAGGFEANEKLRAAHLGPNWKHAYIRGTPFNTGDLFSIASRDAHALSTGDWSGCHSVAWDFNAPPTAGNRSISNEYTKSGYPLGLMLNKDGRRFVDEGVDLRNFTYAKFGRAILEQPGSFAFQIWDNVGKGLLRDEEYRDEVAEKVTAGSLEELARKLVDKGLEDKEGFVNTVLEYNQAVLTHRRLHSNLQFNPAVKDQLSTQSAEGGLQLPKSNWALPLTEPLFVAVKVGCGITFTFGGLLINAKTACVQREGSSGGDGNGRATEDIEGLYAAGEMVGGLFYHNYPGGSGLTSGAVFGKIAGEAAAGMTIELERA